MVKGTSAPAPASVMLKLGDKALTVNDVSLEMWGTSRVQEVCVCVRHQPSIRVGAVWERFRRAPRGLLGTHRPPPPPAIGVQALMHLTRNMCPETPARMRFFRPRPRLGAPSDFMIVTGGWEGAWVGGWGATQCPH